MTNDGLERFVPLFEDLSKETKNMKDIKKMVNAAPTKSKAISTLDEWKSDGAITEDMYDRGRFLVREVFSFR